MKYKLIKQYPGSKSLGSIEEVNDTSKAYDSYPEFWQEVKKFPKVVAVRNKDTKVSINTATNTSQESINLWVNDPHYEIYSIQVESGEIFTVGDKVKWDWVECDISYFTIKSFYKKDGKFRLDTVENSAQGFNLDFLLKYNLQKVIPIFTTDDGVELSEGYTCWVVDTMWEINVRFISSNPKKVEGCKYFSTEEAAEKYIDENKPVYSKKNIKDAILKGMNMDWFAKTYGPISVYNAVVFVTNFLEEKKYE
jgi:hypothetical protein